MRFKTVETQARSLSAQRCRNCVTIGDMSDPALEDLIRQGVEAWNRSRVDGGVPLSPDLSGANLAWADLLAADLREANLRGADLSKANLSEANLKRADLSDANLAWADLREANLLAADLRGADLLAAKLSKANLSEANLKRADLSGANLSEANLSKADLNKSNLSAGANLSEANLSKANLRGAALRGAYLFDADLSGAKLREADLLAAYLLGANLRGANLRGANLRGANLRGATLREANLRGADLSEALLVSSDVQDAQFSGARIHGVAVWDLRGTPADQVDLVITRSDEAELTVDNLKIAQFVYLLLDNPEIREVIDTVARKVVLILGRFTPERKAILDALRNALRARDYAPILFDFDKPAARDLTETVRTLAHLARFVLADLTDPKSLPQELQAVVPDLAVPFAPILQRGQEPYSMFADLHRKYHWLLDVHYYDDQDALLADLQAAVIEPAERKAHELIR
jgi:uncharacterized protein YjbI with pentapeptide repeats